MLFTDIAGSTERASALGDAGWKDLLAAHDQLALQVGSSHDFTPAGRRTFAGIAREWEVFIATR